MHWQGLHFSYLKSKHTSNVCIHLYLSIFCFILLCKNCLFLFKYLWLFIFTFLVLLKWHFYLIGPTTTEDKTFKSPKKGIKQRLSFKKKKKDKNISPEKAISSTKDNISSPPGSISPTNTSLQTENVSAPKNVTSPSKLDVGGKKRTKKACVVM